MNYKVVKELPISGSGCERVNIKVENATLKVSCKYHDDLGKYMELKFNFRLFTSYKFSIELCNETFVSQSYDSICELFETDWINHFRRIEKKHKPCRCVSKHFAVFLSNYGYLEVMADEFYLVGVEEICQS